VSGELSPTRFKNLGATEDQANAAATIGDLGAEHQEGARRLFGVAQIVEAILNDQDFMRQIAYDAMHDFIDHERRHMAMEERLLFPAAQGAAAS
jgi:hemerythrin-like domain-containing protein